MAEPRWLEVKIQCSGELAEALAEVLGRFVINGAVIESVTRFDPGTQENLPTGEMQVFGYLPVDDQLETTKLKLEEGLWHLGQIIPVPEPTFTLIHDEDWMAAWKQHYQPITIGEKLLVMPAWMTSDANEQRIVIKINPAMAFGTGTHPTTQLCLQLLERYCQPGGDVIDVGCGSGILSIAAIRLGAKRVLAVDIDELSVRSTRENAGLNEIDLSSLETGKGSVEEILTGRFAFKGAPLVLVNILAPVIIRLFGVGLADLVSDHGKLLLSGLLDHQEEDVIKAAMERGFEPVERLVDGDWVSLAMVNND